MEPDKSGGPQAVLTKGAIGSSVPTGNREDEQIIRRRTIITIDSSRPSFEDKKYDGAMSAEVGETACGRITIHVKNLPRNSEATSRMNEITTALSDRSYLKDCWISPSTVPLRPSAVQDPSWISSTTRCSARDISMSLTNLNASDKVLCGRRMSCDLGTDHLQQSMCNSPSVSLETLPPRSADFVPEAKSKQVAKCAQKNKANDMFLPLAEPRVPPSHGKGLDIKSTTKAAVPNESRVSNWNNPDKDCRNKTPDKHAKMKAQPVEYLDWLKGMGSLGGTDDYAASNDLDMCPEEYYYDEFTTVDHEPARKANSAAFDHNSNKNIEIVETVKTRTPKSILKNNGSAKQSFVSPITEDEGRSSRKSTILAATPGPFGNSDYIEDQSPDDSNYSEEVKALARKLEYHQREALLGSRLMSLASGEDGISFTGTLTSSPALQPVRTPSDAEISNSLPELHRSTFNQNSKRRSPRVAALNGRSEPAGFSILFHSADATKRLYSEHGANASENGDSNAEISATIRKTDESLAHKILPPTDTEASHTSCPIADSTEIVESNPTAPIVLDGDGAKGANGKETAYDNKPDHANDEEAETGSSTPTTEHQAVPPSMLLTSGMAVEKARQIVRQYFDVSETENIKKRQQRRATKKHPVEAVEETGGHEPVRLANELACFSQCSNSSSASCDTHSESNSECSMVESTDSGNVSIPTADSVLVSHSSLSPSTSMEPLPQRPSVMSRSRSPVKSRIPLRIPRPLSSVSIISACDEEKPRAEKTIQPIASVKLHEAPASVVKRFGRSYSHDKRPMLAKTHSASSIHLTPKLINGKTGFGNRSSVAAVSHLKKT